MSEEEGSENESIINRDPENMNSQELLRYLYYRVDNGLQEAKQERKEIKTDVCEATDKINHVETRVANNEEIVQPLRGIWTRVRDRIASGVAWLVIGAIVVSGFLALNALDLVAKIRRVFS